jgi:hypothetical protein
LIEAQLIARRRISKTMEEAAKGKKQQKANIPKGDAAEAGQHSC